MDNIVTSFWVLFLCLLLAWKFVLSKLLKYIHHNLRIQALPIPELRGNNNNRLFGFIFEILGQPWINPEIPRTSLILQYLNGVCKLIKDTSIVRMNAGIFKQVIFFCKADTVECVLSSYKALSKSSEYHFARPWIGLGLLTSTGEKWKKDRRLLNPTFNSRILEQFLPIMNEKSNILVRIIKDDVRKENIEIQNLVSNCALDIITETAMGTNIDVQGKHGKSISPYVTSIKRVTALFTRRALSPWLWPDLLFRLSPSGREFYKELSVVHSFLKQIIMKRKENLSRESKESLQNEEPFQKKSMTTFLDLLLLHNTTCKPEERLSDQDIQDEVHTFGFAGYDTVSSTTTWVIYYLGHHLSLQKLAHEEIDDVFQGDVQREITLDDLKLMPYLHRVIKESQRLTPVVPVLLRELKDEITVKGITIPGGTTVCALLTVLHMDPEVFPKPETFNPDRFLDSKISPYAFVPFSAGPRNCIGKKYALYEMKTILADLLRNFEWTSLTPRDQVLQDPGPITQPSRILQFDFRIRD